MYIQELSKGQGNNTDIKYIDLSDTDPFFPSGFCGNEVDGTDEFTRYYQYFYEQLSMDYLKQDYPYDHALNGDPIAKERYEKTLAKRREAYHTKKSEQTA